MKKKDLYIEKLKGLPEWEPFLLQESGLPGPRANLELVQAVLELGNEEMFKSYISLDPQEAPVDSPREFLAVCGVAGLGRLVLEGKKEYMEVLRRLASDPRWRVREGVVIALQHFGASDMEALLEYMEIWSKGSLLEKRAAAAALCEPKLLGKPDQVKRVLSILDRITSSIYDVKNRKDEDFQVLRKGLAYCWSVATVALPEEGKKLMEKWFSSEDKDIRWIMRENLKKERLKKMDAGWVQYCEPLVTAVP